MSPELDPYHVFFFFVTVFSFQLGRAERKEVQKCTKQCLLTEAKSGRSFRVPVSPGISLFVLFVISAAREAS